MGEAKVGEEFITHEFDEAIAVQRATCDALTDELAAYAVEIASAAA